jgi:hypothetical protein
MPVKGHLYIKQFPAITKENTMLPDVMEIKDRLKELQARLELLRGHL